jgi:transcriptional regulator with XRE-family HTH domain
MKGSELKKILQSEGVNLSELAKKLGFDSDQRLHSALKAEDVKSGLIEKIARATNKSVGHFYQTNIAIATDNGVAYNQINEQELNTNDRFIALLEKKDEQMDRLLTIIENKL